MSFLSMRKKQKNVPNQGRFYSQLGNVSFPTWEHFIPKVGINFFQRSRSGTHVQAHLNSASPLGSSKNAPASNKCILNAQEPIGSTHVHILYMPHIHLSYSANLKIFPKIFVCFKINLYLCKIIKPI